nr:MAG TPA: Endonuclease [Caudoviricetes sp.]
MLMDTTIMRNKYGNKKINTPDGKFDSHKEYSEWINLKILEKTGKIKNLERQKEFQLIPTIRTSQETLRRTSYIADFFYFDINLNSYVVQDTKGFPTPEYIIKKKLMLWLYPKIIFKESGKTLKIYKNTII